MLMHSLSFAFVPLTNLYVSAFINIFQPSFYENTHTHTHRHTHTHTQSFFLSFALSLSLFALSLSHTHTHTQTHTHTYTHISCQRKSTACSKIKIFYIFKRNWLNFIECFEEKTNGHYVHQNISLLLHCYKPIQRLRATCFIDGQYNTVLLWHITDIIYAPLKLFT